MDPKDIIQSTEEVQADLDEPPERNQMSASFWSSPKLHTSAYTRPLAPAYARRESLLTRQLHSETEHSDEDRISPVRGLSTVSTWSNPSVASTAELTSDDGKSMPSPAISPPLPPTSLRNIIPVTDNKPLVEPKIIGLETVSKDPVEAGLGRKRCITFACANKIETKPEVKPEAKPASPPKRKCALKFVCPTKVTTKDESTPVKRFGSPSPKHRRSSSSSKTKLRISDSNVSTPTSPRATRKQLASVDNAEKSSPIKVKTARPRDLDNSDDSGREATRFHEFATSEDEPDEWTQESTCYRNRLCVADTLKKENVIRKLGEEVEAEEDELDEDDEDEDAVDDDDENDEDDEDDDEEDDDESDAGFHSDDEEGFAVSDSEEEAGSDNEWWTPGGLSTAATSAEHLEQLNKIAAQDRIYASSVASESSNVESRPQVFRSHSKTSALDIERPVTPDLPDSTDFVCGTLDEDRPQEQAYINCMKEREAAKHRPIPQDIDPTFPTSDPEMDEEDDEDLEDPASSDNEAMMHGSLDSLHGTARRISTSRRGSIRPRSPRQKSPAPRARSPAPRAKSPAPKAVRAKSPAPKAIRSKSPAPKMRSKSPAPKAIRAKSPAPKIRSKSPAPKIRLGRRTSPAPILARSPAPRKLFGHSPLRHQMPPTPTRMTSPPNTRRASPMAFALPDHGLAQRPNTLTVAASLPKRPGGFLLSRLGSRDSENESSDTVAPHHIRGGRRRGAIDIVKGLEKKKQRRREKLAQKHAIKAAARGDDRKKVKPGRGCERMREVGLELQKYKGGAGHIISC